MTRRPIIAGNWKMHTTTAEAAALAQTVLQGLPPSPLPEVVLCPPFTALSAVAQVLGPTRRVALGAQDCFWAQEGAYTGEIAPAMLRDLGCQYVILGHSERRHILQESDAQVQHKLRAALAADLSPILCVGELLAEREAGLTEAVVARQLWAALVGVPAAAASRVVVAYEPVWAIGTGRAASPDDALAVTEAIRRELERLWGDAANATRVQYGGSVKPENVADYMAHEVIDGALVGGASLAAGSFLALIEAGMQGKRGVGGG